MDDKVCVVVGAGPGLGLSVARRFARERYRIALLTRRLEVLEGHLRPMTDDGIKLCPIQMDAGSPESIATAFARVRSEIGDPSVMVYNASITNESVPSKLDPASLVDDFRVNVVGALVSTQEALPAMRARGRGTLLFSGGGLALDPYPAVAALAVGKAGIRSLALSLHKELAPEGIHAATVTICGYIQPQTPFAPELIAEHYWQLHTQPRERWQAEITLRAAPGGDPNEFVLP